MDSRYGLSGLAIIVLGILWGVNSVPNQRSEPTRIVEEPIKVVEVLKPGECFYDKNDIDQRDFGQPVLPKPEYIQCVISTGKDGFIFCQTHLFEGEYKIPWYGCYGTRAWYREVVRTECPTTIANCLEEGADK